MTGTENRAPDPRPARTKAAIRTAARELSAADGEVTVNALAKLAGVSRAAFYSHFGGLDDLMGDLMGQLIDRNRKRSAMLRESGRSIHHQVRTSVDATAQHVAEHQAFLRGALSWNVTHHTYLTLVATLAEQHRVALEELGDTVPAGIPVREMARFLAGGVLEVIIQWLLDAEQAAAQGRTLPARDLTERLLRVEPTWYTGIDPGDPIPEEL